MRWIGIILIGVAILMYAVPRASGETLWQLVRCDPGQPCRNRGAPLPHTACQTDMVGDTIVAPKGARLRCEPVRDASEAKK